MGRTSTPPSGDEGLALRSPCRRVSWEPARMTSPILLSGATSNTGQVIAELLRGRDRSFVAMVRNPARRRVVEDLGMRAIIGDYDDPASLERALVGIETAYLVCTPDEHLLRRELAFIEAAKRVGVRHIVKC